MLFHFLKYQILSNLVRTLWSGQYKTFLHKNIPIDIKLFLLHPNWQHNGSCVPAWPEPVSCRPLPRFAITAVTSPHFAGKRHWTAGQGSGQGLGLQSSSPKLENWKQKYFSLNNSASGAEGSAVCAQFDQESVGGCNALNIRLLSTRKSMWLRWISAVSELAAAGDSDLTRAKNSGQDHTVTSDTPGKHLTSPQWPPAPCTASLAPGVAGVHIRWGMVMCCQMCTHLSLMAYGIEAVDRLAIIL